jgi:hypothetical protein
MLPRHCTQFIGGSQQPSILGLLPLLVCVYALWSAGRSVDSDSAVTELLVQKLVSERPMLLPRPVLTRAGGDVPAGGLLSNDQSAGLPQGLCSTRQ